MSTPVIIEVALNGSERRKRSPHRPVLPDEIAADALACLDAGASIVHNHIDRVMLPVDDAVARYCEAWNQVWAERPDAIFYPTINGGPVEDSYGHERALAAAGMRLGLVEPGSLTHGDFVWVNSTKDYEHQAQLCEEHELGVTIPIFEPGFLRNALRLWNEGRFAHGGIVKFYFCDDGGFYGGRFGLPPTLLALDVYLSMFDGSALPWSASVLGGDLVATDLAKRALERGGHLKVGLEDYAGNRDPTNTELVREAVALCEEMGRPVASTREAAEIMGLSRRPPTT